MLTQTLTLPRTSQLKDALDRLEREEALTGRMRVELARLQPFEIQAKELEETVREGVLGGRGQCHTVCADSQPNHLHITSVHELRAAMAWSHACLELVMHARPHTTPAHGHRWRTCATGCA